MATYWVTQRVEEAPTGEESTWQDRVYNLPEAEVILDYGTKLKVKTMDEIALRIVCSDVCRIERV